MNAGVASFLLFAAVLLLILSRQCESTQSISPNLRPSSLLKASSSIYYGPYQIKIVNSLAGHQLYEHVAEYVAGSRIATVKDEFLRHGNHYYFYILHDAVLTQTK